MQDRFTRHLVDVLAAGTAGAGEGEIQLPVGDLKGGGDIHKGIIPGRQLRARGGNGRRRSPGGRLS